MSLNSEVALKCLCLPGAIKQSELWHKATQRLRTERRLWANVKMNPTAKTGVTFFCPPRRQRDINGSIHHHEERGWGPAAGDDGKSSSVKSQVLDLLFLPFFFFFWWIHCWFTLLFNQKITGLLVWFPDILYGFAPASLCGHACSPCTQVYWPQSGVNVSVNRCLSLWRTTSAECGWFLLFTNNVSFFPTVNLL